MSMYSTRFRSLRPGPASPPRPMKIKSFPLAVVLAFCCAGSSHAQLLTFLNPSQTPSASAATRAAWLASVGITAPQFTEDFETGYVDGQNIHDTLITAGVGISDTGSGTPGVFIEGIREASADRIRSARFPPSTIRGRFSY